MGENMESIKDRLPSETNFIRILWCDNASIIRAKALHIDNIHDDDDISVGISRAQQGVPVMFDGVVEGCGLDPVGEIKLKGDISTLTNIPYAPGHVRLMGDMIEKEKVWGNCPRGFLKRMINELSKEGLELKSSFENEFYLLTADEIKSTDNTPFASTYAMDMQIELIKEIVESLKAQKIIVEQYYPESGPGQHEITMVYDKALKSADNQLIFRETVKAVSRKYGFCASFLPRIFPDKAGNGCHLHFSLWSYGKNMMHDPNTKYGLSKTAQYFMAGIMHHLPSLMAITTPLTLSYERIKPQMWSGAYKAWGLNNREAALRVIQEDNRDIKHIEFKTMDATSNPYLALGALIAAGLDGIYNKMELNKPVFKDPAILSASEREKLNIKPLPSNIRQTLDNLKNNHSLLNAIGNDLSKSYLAVKEAEYSALSELSYDEQIDLLLEKY